MNNNPTISVIMPVYNGEKYLCEAIDSILNQTYQDFEFIIINDGSTDNSENIIQSYKDKRIVYLNNEKNSGICVTLNKGLDIAKGKYIARMDCDDISFPKRLETQVRYMEKFPQTAVVGSDIIVFGEDIEDHYFSNPHTPEMCKVGLLFNSSLAHPTVMIRKSVIDNHHLYYKDAYRGREDFELWWQISKIADITNIKEPLLKYRIHSSQVTQNYNTYQIHLAKTFLKERFQDIGVLMTDEQIDLFFYYSSGEYSFFNKDSLYQFINRCIQINNSYPARTHREKYALEKTLSYSILNIITNAKLYPEKKQCVKLMYKNGLMPFSIFVKCKLRQLFSIS